MFGFVFAGALALLEAGTEVDVRLTDKGIKAGVSVEGNTLIVKMFGDKPSLHESYLGAWVCNAIAIAPAVVGFFISPALFWAGIGGIVVFAGKHVWAGLCWRTLLKQNGKW